MNNDIEKSKKAVRELIMKTHHPEEWAEEQAKQAQEAAKGKPVFVTDANDPKGFRPSR